MQSSPALPGPTFLNPIDFLATIWDAGPWLLDARRRYGDTFEVPTVLGPMVFTCDPELVRTLFTADPDTMAQFQPELSSPFLGETSLVLVNGARHRRDRKLLSPPFNGARMRAYGAIMIEAAERAAAAWKPGAPFKMLDVTQDISLEVILRAVFGLDYRAPRALEVRDAVVKFAGSMSPLFLLFAPLRREFLGLGPWSRFLRCRERLDGLLFAEIARRREESREESEGHTDILGLMMSARYEDGGGMSDSDLRDELLTLLFAGHETTAIALAWAFHFLHRDPAELARVLAEIESLPRGAPPDAIAALPYLDAVCQESLRIHPIVADLARTLLKPLELPGRTLHAGTVIMISAVMMHNREELYPEPQIFRPSRFLLRKFSPFELLPFGGGARRCIGSAFALYEMKLVLATVLRSHRLRLVQKAPVKPRRRGLTVGPANGIPMTWEGRRES